MKDVFYGWLAFQLIVVGISGVYTYNMQLDGKCDETKTRMSYELVIVPIIFFLPEYQWDCKNVKK